MDQAILALPVVEDTSVHDSNHQPNSLENSLLKALCVDVLEV